MNNMRNKILSLLVLLLTAATGAQADIAVGDVFMFDDNAYIKINKFDFEYAVNLETGELQRFGEFSRVTAVEAELNIY